MGVTYKKLDVLFFRTETGAEPVREWLAGLPKQDKKVIGEDVKTVQFGWPLGMPLVDSLGFALWEVRIKLSGGRIARVIFFMEHHSMILLNGFIKKSRKTPAYELELAKKRKSQYKIRP